MTKFIMLYDWNGPPEPDGFTHLILKADDIVTLVDDSDEGWWEGTFNGKTGYFPSNYVEEYVEQEEEEEEEMPPEPESEDDVVEGKAISDIKHRERMDSIAVRKEPVIVKKEPEEEKVKVVSGRKLFDDKIAKSYEEYTFTKSDKDDYRQLKVMKGLHPFEKFRHLRTPANYTKRIMFSKKLALNMCRWQKEPIPRSLYKLSKDLCGSLKYSRELKKISVRIFHCIRVFMKDIEPLDDEPEELHEYAKEIIDHGVGEKLLCDEIFCQIVKQTCLNEGKESNLLGWKLFFIFSLVLIPSKEMFEVLCTHCVAQSHKHLTDKWEYKLDSIPNIATSTYLMLRRYCKSTTAKQQKAYPRIVQITKGIIDGTWCPYGKRPEKKLTSHVVEERLSHSSKSTRSEKPPLRSAKSISSVYSNGNSDSGQKLSVKPAAKKPVETLEEDPEMIEPPDDVDLDDEDVEMPMPPDDDDPIDEDPEMIAPPDDIEMDPDMPDIDLDFDIDFDEPAPAKKVMTLQEQIAAAKAKRGTGESKGPVTTAPPKKKTLSLAEQIAARANKRKNNMANGGPVMKEVKRKEPVKRSMTMQEQLAMRFNKRKKTIDAGIKPTVAKTTIASPKKTVPAIKKTIPAIKKTVPVIKKEEPVAVKKAIPRPIKKEEPATAIPKHVKKSGRRGIQKSLRRNKKLANVSMPPDLFSPKKETAPVAVKKTIPRNITPPKRKGSHAPPELDDNEFVAPPSDDEDPPPMPSDEEEMPLPEEKPKPKKRKPKPVKEDTPGDFPPPPPEKKKKKKKKKKKRAPPVH